MNSYYNSDVVIHDEFFFLSGQSNWRLKEFWAKKNCTSLDEERNSFSFSVLDARIVSLPNSTSFNDFFGTDRVSFFFFPAHIPLPPRPFLRPIFPPRSSGDVFVRPSRDREMTRLPEDPRLLAIRQRLLLHGFWLSWLEPTETRLQWWGLGSLSLSRRYATGILRYNNERRRRKLGVSLAELSGVHPCPYTLFAPRRAHSTIAATDRTGPYRYTTFSRIFIFDFLFFFVN